MSFTHAQRQQGHATLAKYRIHTWVSGDQTFWSARVPYGSYRRFDSWAEAAAWLAYKHGQRVAKSERLRARVESLSAPNGRQA